MSIKGIEREGLSPTAGEGAGLWTPAGIYHALEAGPGDGFYRYILKIMVFCHNREADEVLTYQAPI